MNQPIDSKPHAHLGRKAELSAKAIGKPKVTRPRKSPTSSVVSKLTKTHSGMLHQSRTLKTPTADKSQERRETRRSPRKPGKLADNMVEMSAPAPAGAVTPVRISGGETGAVTRPFVLGRGKRPLMPAHPARVRQLLRDRKATVSRRFPFIIRLKIRKDGETQPLTVKLDPGAKTTGIALVRLVQYNTGIQSVLFLAELTHRGTQIRDSLTQRSSFRRRRRSANLRYRAPRFLNRGIPKGWLPPSLRHRLQTTMSWVTRLCRWAPITGLSQELVRFDMQRIENPEISGVEYQRGTLADYEVWEYLLERDGRRCAYCNAENIPLEREHIVPRCVGGSNRISNLTLACHPCNQAKGSMPIEDFVKDEARLQRILAKAKASLADASAVNATRFALLEALQATDLPVETATGGLTKWNRTRLGLGKTHALDAACVGNVSELRNTGAPALSIRCYGRGSHKRTRLTPHGFPRGYLSPAKSHYGFRTGDIVTASVPSGVHAGRHSGRVAVRKSGRFNIQTASGTTQGISKKHCRKLQPADGYAYQQSHAEFPPRPSLTAMNAVSTLSL